MTELSTPEAAHDVLRSARVVAVLGASSNPAKPASYVPRYLAEHGYRVLPVNPRHEGEELFGARCAARLQDLQAPVDVVDVFRPSEKLPEHLDDILAMRPKPKVVWLQEGIRNDTVAQKLVDAGVDVVQDRCAMAEHKRLPRA